MEGLAEEPGAAVYYVHLCRCRCSYEASMKGEEEPGMAVAGNWGGLRVTEEEEEEAGGLAAWSP